MRVVEWAVFGVREPALDAIRLTKAERQTLRSAARILDAVREARNARMPEDWYAGDEDDMDLAHGSDICEQLAGRGEIDAETVAS